MCLISAPDVWVCRSLRSRAVRNDPRQRFWWKRDVWLHTQTSGASRRVTMCSPWFGHIRHSLHLARFSAYLYIARLHRHLNPRKCLRFGPSRGGPKNHGRKLAEFMKFRQVNIPCTSVSHSIIGPFVLIQRFKCSEIHVVFNPEPWKYFQAKGTTPAGPIPQKWWNDQLADMNYSMDKTMK